MNKQKVSTGKYISLTYAIKDENGNTLEQSDLPVGYVFGGETELLGGMDKSLKGHSIGDRVEFKVAPEDGFGEHDPSLTFTDDINNVPPEFRKIGAEVSMQNEAGESKTFFVTKITDKTVTIDGNHVLAGKELTVSVKIMDIRTPTQEDIQMAGKPQGMIN